MTSGNAEVACASRKEKVDAVLRYYLTPPANIEPPVYLIGTARDRLQARDERRVEIHDLRGKANDFDLDTHGVQLVQQTSTFERFSHQDEVKDKYYPEIANLLKQVTGASKIIPFSHIHRTDKWQTGIEASRKAADPEEVIKPMVPAMFVHIDQSYNGAAEVLRDNAGSPNEAARLARTRWAIIKVWRPIRIPVPREPLAVCDARSVSESDLVEMRTHLPQRQTQSSFADVSKGSGFEIRYVKYNPRNQWYYASHMRPDECMLIKCFDSKKDGVARRSPHGAFQLEGQDEKAPARESIETRCLVCWEDQAAQ